MKIIYFLIIPLFCFRLNQSDNNSVAFFSFLQKSDTLKQKIVSINGIIFRTTFHNDSCLVEKKVNQKWIKNLSYLYSRRTNSIFTDINNDNHLDIVNTWKHGSEVYLFNSSTKLFDTIPILLNEDRSLIDSTRNIFCDVLNIKGHWLQSNLYTFSNRRLKVLFSLKFIANSDKKNTKTEINGLELYKGDFHEKQTNPTLISTTKLSSSGEFDYVKYWNKKYKELLGYR